MRERGLLIRGPAEVARLLEDKRALLRSDGAPGCVTFAPFVPGATGTGRVVWDVRARLLHIRFDLALVLPPQRAPAMADAITIVNHALVVPGFGVDPQGPQVYFRWVIPRPAGDAFGAEEIDRALLTVLESVRDFQPALRAVAAGGIASADVMLVAESGRMPSANG
jgi:hypothetical protein